MTYDHIKALNWSRLSAMARSPLHFRYAETHRRPGTDDMVQGQANHCMVLEPERFPEQFVVYPGAVRRGKEWDAFKAEAGNKTILTKHQHETAISVAEAVLAHPVATQYLDRAGAEFEKTLTWSDPETGTLCKGRLDVLRLQELPAIVDLKQTRAIDDRAFSAAVVRYGYHGQLGGWYRRGVRAVTGRDLPVVIIAHEAAPPHDVAVYRLDEAALELGDQLASRLLSRYLACEEAGTWPGAHPVEETLSLPAWADPEALADPDWVTGDAA